MTKKQLAQKRNFFKYQLLGTKFEIINNWEALNAEEVDLLYELTLIKQRLVSRFDHNSRELGLRVPEFKCWCGKEAKYFPNTNSSTSMVCYRHRDE